MKMISTKIFLLFFSLFAFTANNITAQVFDWEWQNPFPTGADHNDAVVLSPTKFMLFGNGGSVLTSTDAGNTWTRANVDPLYRDFYSATFADANTGYAAGTGGLLMKTTDGGATWTDIAPAATNTLWDVDFIDPSTGFAVGASGTIHYTTNGGTNWTTSNYGTTTLYKIHFINSTLGYLGSASTTTGRLMRTTDGGATWVDITASVTGLGGTVRGIHFIDTNNGFVSNSNGRIFKTTDGGTTWSQVYDIGSTTTTIYEVKFFDLLNGYAITSAGRVLKTSDGGTTWNLIQTAATKNLYGLGLLGIQSGGSSPILIGGDAGTIIKSMDNGATWDLAFTSASQEQLQRASFPTETVGYAVGGSISTGNQFGDILKTTNGGLSWSKLSFDPGYRVYSVFFIDENTGYVGVQGPTGVYKTTDGGQNWTQLNTGTGVSTSIVYDIKFLNPQTGFAVYSSGQVARTTDAGATWSPVSAGWGSAAGYDMFIVNSSVIYICGSGGRISKSTNGGVSFTQLPSLGTATLYSLHFHNENTGFIAASGGRIFKTTDGTTFTEIVNPLTTTLYVIRFFTNDIGWVGASGGDVYYTLDGGQTWTESDISIGPSQSTRDIQFAGNRMYVIGTDGMIIRGFADPLIPVELTSFTALVSGSTVNLNWMTATELNNSGFAIERKTVSSNYEQIGFVSGNGTTSERSFYSFADKELAYGTYTYRLKQIDFDGTFSYSSEVEVEVGLPFSFSLEQNYPNPFNPTTSIRFAVPKTTSVKLSVYNTLGEEVAVLVNEVKEAGYHSVEWNGNNHNNINLPSGVYIYRIESPEYNSSKKMIMLK